MDLGFVTDGLTAKQEKDLEGGVAILSGIAAWEFQSTQKFDAGVSILSSQRFADALSNTFGPQVASSLFPKVTLRSPGAAMSPAGIFNKTTFSGIGLMIFDAVANEIVGAEYRKADGLRPLVRGLGRGLLGGGIVGGFFDPFSASRPGGLSGVALTAPLGAPQPSGYGTSAALSSYVNVAAQLNKQLGG